MGKIKYLEAGVGKTACFEHLADLRHILQEVVWAVLWSVEELSAIMLHQRRHQHGGGCGAEQRERVNEVIFSGEVVVHKVHHPLPSTAPHIPVTISSHLPLRYIRLGGKSSVQLAHDEVHVHIGEAVPTELVHSLHLGADFQTPSFKEIDSFQ